MLDQILSYFLEQPRRLFALGSALSRGGAFLLLSGLIGHAATNSVAVVRGMAGQMLVEVDLAAVFPGVPTWWVPEGPAGFILAGAFLVVGLMILRVGRCYERMLRY